MKKRCFLDMDGVLVDFIKGICEAHERDNPYSDAKNAGSYWLHKIWGISNTKFWEPAQDADFWADLDKTPECDEIISRVEMVFGENVCLLTAPSLAPGCMEGKREWITRNIPRYRDQFLIGSAKEFCGFPGSYLVDDMEKNIVKFQEAGGNGILFPRPWNRLHEHSDEPLRFLNFKD